MYIFTVEIKILIKEGKEHQDVSCSLGAKYYSLNMNGFDKTYRYGRENLVTIRVNRWHLHVWFWKIEQVMHCVYVIFICIAKVGHRQN